jgi:hypothetical protein
MMQTMKVITVQICFLHFFISVKLPNCGGNQGLIAFHFFSEFSSPWDARSYFKN